MGTIAPPAGEDLTATPPGSPLAPPLIYSLIHSCCYHMASLCPPSFPAPPPPSYLRIAHLLGLSIKPCLFILPCSSLLLFLFFPPPFSSLILCILTPLQQDLPSPSFACAAVHSQGQHRFNLTIVSIWYILERATKVLCVFVYTWGVKVGGVHSVLFGNCLAANVRILFHG